MRVDAVGAYRLLGETQTTRRRGIDKRRRSSSASATPAEPRCPRLPSAAFPALSAPRPMLGSGDLDFSFSGLKTAVLLAAPRRRSAAYPDIARAFVDAVVDLLVAKCVRALQMHGLRRLVAGGVGANKQLRAALDSEARKARVRRLYPEPELCTDNGAMSPFAAAQRLARGAPPAHMRSP